MTTPASPPPTVAIALPSARKLAMTTVAALAVAAIILVTIVLPAEYGVDPLGTGERLGLTVMSRPPVIEPITMPEGHALKPIANGAENQYGAPYKVDSIEFTLGPYDYLEYKYAMEAGAQMQFSWKATAPVIHDFHGERADDPNQVTSFDKSNRQEAHGALTAPFTGIHGWYWENPGTGTITVTLKSSGFYDRAIEFKSDRTTVPHRLAVP